VATFGISIRQDLAMSADGVFDAARYAAVIAEAEQLGYHHVFFADHVFVPPWMAKVVGDTYLEPFTLLSYLAAKTSSIELVISCLVVPYRQPFTTAEAVSTLDQLSGGRCALGVVPGYLNEEFETFNLDIEKRGEMTNEFVKIMIEVWTNDAATYEGKYYSCDAINVKPKCVRKPHVPIWVGGSSKMALRRVAEFGDVWHPLGFTVMDDKYRAAHADELAGKKMQTSGTTPDRLREDLSYLHRLADEAGRDLSGLQVVVFPGLPDGDSIASSRDEALGVAEGGDRVIEWLNRYVEAGATGFVVAPPGNSLDECVEHLRSYAAEVMPRIAG
jgi:probable F420-dependent oxidoreductase